MANRHERPDADAALLGVPTGESLSRDTLDDLEFSTKRQERPKGLSRAQYMRSGPGSETQSLMALAGMLRRRRMVTMILTVAVIAAGAAVVWWLVV